MNNAVPFPKISIVTPTYNRAAMLVQTIESIIAQSFTNWEHIIVDDGSTDETPAVVQKYLSDPRIQYIQRENAGAAAARNFGVSLATGKMIAFLDSDDEALPGWLEKVSEHIRHDTGVISVGAIRKFEGGTTHFEKPFKIKMYGRTVKAKLTCGSFFFRKELFDAIGGYDTAIRSGFQTEMGLRILTEALNRKLQIISIDECLMRINIHNGERMRNDWNTLAHDHALFLERVHRFYYENDKNELANNYAVLAFYCHKSKAKKKAVKSILQAIRYKPFAAKNYLRAFKYAVK